MRLSSGHSRRKKPRLSSATRDWTALPQDILFTVFLKLEPREILRGADRASTAWRRVAVGDLMLWRHLDMGTVALSRCRWRAAVRHGTGLCESFSARCCRNATLQFLVQGAPFLKRLRLLDANISSEALNEVIQNFTSLEELELPKFYTIMYKKLIQCICEAHPNLKTLILTVPRSCNGRVYYQQNFVIPVMCELRSFELTLYDFTVEESMAMIDNCPLLKSLHINCFIKKKRHFVKELRERCGAKNLTITSDLDEECVLESCKEQPEMGRGNRTRKHVDRLNLQHTVVMN
ncbi:unnamed protein product [Urochloa humidicola]